MDDFEDERYRDDDDDDQSSLSDDIKDAKDKAKDLKEKVKDHKSQKNDVKGDSKSLNNNPTSSQTSSSMSDGGKSFNNQLRSTSSSRPVNPSAASNGGSGAMGGTTGAAEGGAATSGAATGGAAAEGGAAATGAAAEGGAAAGGAAAGGTAAGGAAAGGAAAGGAAAGGAAAATGAAAAASATGVGAIVVAAIGLLIALKKISDKINKKIEDTTGIDAKHMKWIIPLGIILIIVIILEAALYTNSNTARTSLQELIERREKLNDKKLITFTDEEYDDLINTDHGKDDPCYKTIISGQKSQDNFMSEADTKEIFGDDFINDLKAQGKSDSEISKVQETKKTNLAADRVKEYLKAERNNFNKIIWNTSSAYNKYKYKDHLKFTTYNSYSSDNSGQAQIAENGASISSIDANKLIGLKYFELYKVYRENVEMYTIKDEKGKDTKLEVPEEVVAEEDDKDKAGMYYVNYLQDYLQKWIIPYTMMIDCQDSKFIDKVCNEMYHRVDVDVFKLSKEVKTTTQKYYMKAEKYDIETTFFVSESGVKQVESTSEKKNVEEVTTDKYKPGVKEGSPVEIETVKDSSGKVLGKRKKVTSTHIILSPDNEIAVDSSGQPMVQEITVDRDVSKYKVAPKITNIESFYQIIRENYTISPISESNPPNAVENADDSVDTENGIITKKSDETWYEDLRKNGQTVNKEYSVSYYTEEQQKQLGRKISRVEWAQDYGNPNGTTKTSGAQTGNYTDKIEANGKTYKVYAQSNFGGNIPSEGCGLCCLATVLSAYRPDIDANPDGLANLINWGGPLTLEEHAAQLRNFGLVARAEHWDNYASGYPEKKTQAFNELKANLKAGKPAIILVKAPCPYCKYTGHYMTLVSIDNNDTVTFANSSGGLEQTDSLSNLVDYMFDTTVYENGYVLVESDVSNVNPTVESTASTNEDNVVKATATSASTSTSTSTSSKTKTSDSDAQKKAEEAEKATKDAIKEQNSQKVTEMLKFAESLQGTIPYVWGGPLYDTKEALASGGTDCAGFVISLYKSFFSTNFNPIRVDIYEDCENVDVDGLKGQKVFDGGSGTTWNSEIASIIQPGDVVWTAGHITIYAGDIDGDGVLKTISQGGPDAGPSVREASSYYTYLPIKGIARFVGDALLTSNNVTSKRDNARILPVKTIPELMDAYIKYGLPAQSSVIAGAIVGHGYSYDDLYFAYNQIEEYYKQIDAVNGHSLNSSTKGPGLGWPVDVEKYPKSAIINCFYGNTPAYGGFHNGVDISSGGETTSSGGLTVGPEVIAACDGTVVVATANPTSDADSYTYVEIENESKTIKTQYGHLSKIFVSQGDKVKKGDVIGRMGTTGHSTGTHLHFAIHENGAEEDPLTYYVIGKDDGSDEEVDYSTINKESIVNLPTGYKFLRTKGGDFLTSDCEIDPNYKGTTYPLTDEERSNLQWIVYNEYGSGGYEAMVFQAQCLRDAIVTKYNGSTPLTIQHDMGYDIANYGNSRSVTDNSEDAINAIKYVFDEGGSAVQHEILYMCPDWYYTPNNWHYQASTGSDRTIEKVCQYGSVIYFDRL